LLPDLERLIALQRIETERALAARSIAEVPQRQAALDERAAAGRAAFEQAKSQQAAVAAAKRDAEKDLAAAEARLSKFRDQQNAVKTNKEYQAMLHEIETAKGDVDRLSEQVLLKMDEADAAAASMKLAEAALREVDAGISDEKAALEAERGEAGTRLSTLDADREALVAQIEDPHALFVFEGLIKTRKTVAVVEAVDGLCTECRVRLRPQVFSEIRRNDAIRQCDNCQRIVYHVPKPAAAGDGAGPPSA
jgi:hypothetical protein